MSSAIKPRAGPLFFHFDRRHAIRREGLGYDAGFRFRPGKDPAKGRCAAQPRVGHSAHEVVKLRFEVQFGAEGRASLDNRRAAGRELGQNFLLRHGLKFFNASKSLFNSAAVALKTGVRR